MDQHQCQVGDLSIDVVDMWGPGNSGPGADELTDRLLHAAGARVTAVDIDELGPEVTVARIELATPAGPEHVAARLVDGLAMAITAGARMRVADAVMDRIAVPAGATRAEAGQDGPTPEHTARETTRTRSCSASSWSAPAGSNCAARASPGPRPLVG